jgi:hypothetical protein
MKKVVVVILVLALVLAAIITLKQARPRVVALEPLMEQPTIPWIKPDPNAFAPVEPNRIVFDMTYRGLASTKDELFSRGFWGFGSSEPKPAPEFIKSLKDKGIGPLHLVYNPYFKGAEWSALELKGKKAVAFYIDLDANGKVTANERLTPTPSEEKDAVDFFTPDFCLTTQEQVKVPFRVLLRVQRYDDSDLSCMWGGACVLEGESTLEGQPARLVLFPYGPTGTYDGYGRSMVGLAVGQDRSKVEQVSLSSLVLHEGLFYQLQVQSTTDHRVLRVILARDVSPRGKLTVSVACDKDPEPRLPWATITGRETPVHLSLQQGLEELPVGKYRLDSGQVAYGSGEVSWQCDFQQGPDFDIVESQEAQVRVGQPKVTVRAIPQEKRYQRDVKAQSEYAPGARIYITREVQGLAAESYGRFSKKGDKNWFADVKPHITITDASGQEVIAKDMEYG